MAHPHKDRYRNRYYALEGGCSLYKCDKCGSGPMHIKDGSISSEPCWDCGAVAWRELKEKEFMLETYLCDDLNLESSFTYCQTLPFPIAVVYRKVDNAANNTLRFSSLIELFDVVVRFVVLVLLADSFNSHKAVVQEIPNIGRLSVPPLSYWVSSFKSLLRHYTSGSSRPFLKEIKDFQLDRYTATLDEIATLDEFVQIRNDSFRGHG